MIISRPGVHTIRNNNTKYLCKVCLLQALNSSFDVQWQCKGGQRSERQCRDGQRMRSDAMALAWLTWEGQQSWELNCALPGLTVVLLCPIAIPVPSPIQPYLHPHPGNFLSFSVGDTAAHPGSSWQVTLVSWYTQKYFRAHQQGWAQPQLHINLFMPWLTSPPHQAHPAFPFRAIPCSWHFTFPTGRKCFLMPD